MIYKYALHDLVPFVQFKKHENTHGGVLLLVKLQVTLVRVCLLRFLNGINGTQSHEMSPTEFPKALLAKCPWALLGSWLRYPKKRDMNHLQRDRSSNVELEPYCWYITVTLLALEEICYYRISLKHSPDIYHLRHRIETNSLTSIAKFSFFCYLERSLVPQKLF